MVPDEEDKPAEEASSWWPWGSTPEFDAEAAAAKPDDDPVFVELAEKCPPATPQEARRYWIGQKGDADKAAEMLKAHMEWRAETIPKLLPLEEYHRRWIEDGVFPRPYIRVVPDLDPDPKRPLVILVFGTMVSDQAPEDHIHYALRLLEDLLSREDCRQVVVMFLIERFAEEGDLQDVPGNSADVAYGLEDLGAMSILPIFKYAYEIFSIQQPERLKAAFIWPVSDWIAGLWEGLLSPFMHPVTYAKFRLSTSRDQAVPADLAEVVGEEMRSSAEAVVRNWRKEQWDAFNAKQRCP